MTKEQMELLKNYVGHGMVYGIRPENLIYEKDDGFEKYKDYTFKLKVDIIEILGDILNVYGKIGDAQVIAKMPNKYEISKGDTIKVAIELDYVRFFNETTTKAILQNQNEYEEIEVTKSLDDDNVAIIEKKKKGWFSKKK